MRCKLYKILFSLSEPDRKRTFVEINENIVIDWNLWRTQWHFRKVHHSAEGSYIRRTIDEFPAFQQSDLLLQVLLCSTTFAKQFPVLAQRLDAFKMLLFAEPLNDDSEHRLKAYTLPEDSCLRYKAFRRNFDPWCVFEYRSVLSCVNSVLEAVLAPDQPHSDKFTSVVSLGLLKEQLERRPAQEGFTLETPIVLPPPLSFTADQERRALTDGFRHGVGPAARLNNAGEVIRDINYNVILLRNVLAHIWESRETITSLPLVRFLGQGELPLEDEHERLEIIKKWFETYTQSCPRIIEPVAKAMPSVANELPYVMVCYRYHMPSKKKSEAAVFPKKTYSLPLASGETVKIFFSRFSVYIHAEDLGLIGIDLTSRLKKEGSKFSRPSRVVNDQMFISLDFALANTSPDIQEQLIKWLSGSIDTVKQRLNARKKSKAVRLAHVVPFNEYQDMLLWKMASQVLTPHEKQSLPTLFPEHRSYRTLARYRLIKEIYKRGGELALLKELQSLKDKVGVKAMKANYQAFTAEERKENLLLFFNPEEKDE